MLYKNGINLQKAISDFIRKSQSLLIFSPYIKLDTLKNLIDHEENVKAVFVRWEAKDLIQGTSDLEVYPYLKEKGISLYRNTRLHLKAYLDININNCFITTANISSRALNLPSYLDYNYEIGSILENLNIEDRLYFSIIESESLLITEIIYNELYKQLLNDKKVHQYEEEYFLNYEAPKQDYLISALPMTYCVETFYRLYHDKEFENEIEFNCLLHDLANYKIPLGLSSTEIRNHLSESFFKHKFIEYFLGNLENSGEVYFGTAKEWIHRNCTDVPTPRKWEITRNIQILYRWIVSLGNGKYQVDRPNHSERLYIVQK
jgi:hypothetical protein